LFSSSRNLAVALAAVLVLVGAPVAAQQAEPKTEQRIEKTVEIAEDGTRVEHRVVIVGGPEVGHSSTSGIPGARVLVVRGDGAVVEGSGDEGANVFQWAFESEPFSGGYLGVEVLALTDALRDHFASPRGEGVLISDVAAQSPAAEAGLRAADVVTRVAGESVFTTHDFGRRIRSRDSGEAVELEVWRGGVSSRFTAVLGEREQRTVELGQDGRIVRLEAAAGDEIHLDIDGAATEIREILASGAWRTRVEDLEGIDVLSLERRIRELEEQLRRLEESSAPPPK
jgi:hypothetical protein